MALAQLFVEQPGLVILCLKGGISERAKVVSV